MAIDKMNQRQRIKKLLQDEEVQARVQKNIRRGQEDAKVTIGRASELFNIRPSKLRELDELLQPERSKEAGSGQRQYSLTELNKIAIISELLINEKVPLSDIPSDIDEIWYSVSSFLEESHLLREASDDAYVRMSIDHRVEDANKEEFWRYFAFQAMRMALNLICEDIPDPVAGIILPLKRKMNTTVIQEPQKLAQLGECLVGWRDQNRSYHTFYDPSPFFEFPSDFRVSGLLAVEEQEPKDSTFIVLQRKTKSLYLASPIVEAVRRLLAPIYEDVHVWQSYFDRGMRDFVYPTTSFGSTAVSDSILTSLANMAVRLGGKTTSGQNRWKFCSVLLPNNDLLSLQSRTLFVQAQSDKSPHEIGETFVSPGTPILSLSLRAFQSGHVLYRPNVSAEDRSIEYRRLESPVQSAIAIPIEGRDALPIAVLYLASESAGAFEVEYQRVLRLMCRIIGELLETSRVRQQNEERLRDVVTRPEVVNKTLGTYLSEGELIKDVEDILRSVQKIFDPENNDTTSFISVDIDNLSNVTNKYGDQIVVNLSKALGTRIEEQIGLLFDKPADCKLYHVYATRFYLLLKGVSLEQARENAEKLRQILKVNYEVAILPTSINQPRSEVEIENITVRLGVSSYKHTKFYKLLNERPAETRIADVIAGSVLYYLDIALNVAKQAGGDCIVSYYPPEPPKYDHSRFAPWSPSKKAELE